VQRASRPRRAGTLIALLTRRERSWFVWLGLVPGVLMLGVVALELFWIE
jgi:hypothetical protein